MCWFIMVDICCGTYLLRRCILFDNELNFCLIFLFVKHDVNSCEKLLKLCHIFHLCLCVSVCQQKCTELYDHGFVCYSRITDLKQSHLSSFVTHWYSIAKHAGCFQWHLCLFVCLFVNTITSEL